MTTLVDFLVEPAQRKNNFMLLSAWKNLKKKNLPRGLLYFAKRNEMMNKIGRIEDIKTTVPCKCKLTVSTQTSILDPRSYRELSVSRFEARVSSIEYRDARRIFRGSRWQISRNRLISRTSNNKR